jgi:hypothetical protein
VPHFEHFLTVVSVNMFRNPFLFTIYLDKSRFIGDTAHVVRVTDLFFSFFRVLVYTHVCEGVFTKTFLIPRLVYI